ncbi:E3 ubiquitin-protein ligase RFWD2 [Oopsacas minuta]|uniref:E3 ubiquitin-protein ligase RFWD2 n=1 Tax=Oopsacas minuta TaxID=111878 RepID=A0AAV7JPE0_9METZ|nr:E3 ubiquitin-protein ligase RFWD2 [Oopsacas minuta]
MASHHFPYTGFPSAPTHSNSSPNITSPFETSPVITFHPLTNGDVRTRREREADIVRNFSSELTTLLPIQPNLKPKYEQVALLDDVISDLVSLRRLKEVCTVPISSEEVISCIAWSQPQNKHFALSYNTKIKLYDYRQTLENGLISQYLCCPFEEVKTDSQVLSIAFQRSHISYCLASGEKDGTICLWRYEEQRNTNQFVKDTIDKLASTCWTVSWMPGSTLVTYGGQDGIIRIHECVTKTSMYEWRADASVNALLFANQNLLIAGTSSDAIPLYDLRTPSISIGKLKRVNQGVCALSSIVGSEFEVVSASKDSTLTLWDLRMRRLVRGYRGHKNEDKFVGLANNGKFIAVGTEDDSIILYHKEISSPVMCYNYPPGNMGFVRCLSFHEDEKHLIGGNSTGNVKILKIEMDLP